MPRPDKGVDIYLYKLIDHITPFCCKNNIHPNLITILNIINSVFIYCNLQCISERRNIIIFQIILHLYLDSLDGEVARVCNKQSKLGGYLDTIGDLYFTSIMLLFFLKKYTQYDYYNHNNVLILFLYYITFPVHLCVMKHIHQVIKYIIFLFKKNLSLIFLLFIILLI